MIYLFNNYKVVKFKLSIIIELFNYLYQFHKKLPYKDLKLLILFKKIGVFHF